MLPEGAAALSIITTALILKFDGLARLAEDAEKDGLDRLKACIAYFDKTPEPMFSADRCGDACRESPVPH